MPVDFHVGSILTSCHKQNGPALLIQEVKSLNFSCKHFYPWSANFVLLLILKSIIMKIAEENLIQKLNVPANQVWKLVSQVGGVDQWFGSLITSCKVDGDNRYCETVDGVKLEEKILLINHEERIFKYAIPEQAMLPVENIVGTIKVSADTDDSSEVEWSATFEATEENALIAKEAFKGLWAMGLKEMEGYIKNSMNKDMVA